jgi:hypothetical protein
VQDRKEDCKQSQVSGKITLDLFILEPPEPLSASGLNTNGETANQLAASPVERGYEKHSWALLLIPGLLLGVFAVETLAVGYSQQAPPDLIAGAVTASTPPATISLLNYIARGAAGGTLALMVLALVVACTGYRKGARWAWYVEFYIFAAAAAAGVMESLETGQFTLSRNDLIGFLIFTLPFALGLLLPYRRFLLKSRELMGVLLVLLVGVLL